MKKKRKRKGKSRQHIETKRTGIDATRTSSKKKILSLLAILIYASAVSPTSSKGEKMQAKETIAYASFPQSGDSAIERFFQLLDTLPDDNARLNLKNGISLRKLKPILFFKDGMVLAFEGGCGALLINPETILSESAGFIWSYMVHENRHIEDMLGQHESGKMYAPCVREKHTSHACKLEWWDAEFRAVEQQAIFLKKYNLTGAMSIGRRVNNREIFEKYDARWAALIYLRENYYADKDISPDLLEVFPEFYNKKLAEIR